MVKNADFKSPEGFILQKSYALFDFDGTLRKGDSIVSLCLYAHRRKLCTTGQLLKGIAYAAGYGLHLCSAERAKAAALCWMKGRLVPASAISFSASQSSLPLPRIHGVFSGTSLSG